MKGSIHKGPDFLGIGAARSGTTWIAKQLESHPEVWIPRRKELHYFSRDIKYPSPSFLYDRSLWKRLIGRESYNQRFRNELLYSVGGCISKLDLSRLKWELKYFMGDMSNEWYKNLFTNNNLINGEITPAYALLDDRDVKNLSSQYPELKIIYIIRNPIDRAWSTIKYHEKRQNKALTSLSENEIITYLSQPGILSRSDYLSVIERWKCYFSEQQFLLLYYDDMLSDPEALKIRLADFLGIKRFKISRKKNNTKINASIEKEMPQKIKEYLVSAYTEQIKIQSDRLGGNSLRWYQQLDK